MKANQFSRSLRLALTGAVLTCGATVAFADIRNYEFKLVEPTVKAGPDKTIAVKLVDKTTGKPVPDAVIFATRLDMAPDGMISSTLLTLIVIPAIYALVRGVELGKVSVAKAEPGQAGASVI